MINPGYSLNPRHGGGGERAPGTLYLIIVKATWHADLGVFTNMMNNGSRE